MNDRLDAVLDDLAAESEQLDGWLAGRPDGDWALDTPAAGWTVAHQVGHLLWTDERAIEAATDAAAFMAGIGEAMAAGRGETYVDDGAAELAALGAGVLLARWRASRAGLAAALRAVPEGVRLPWYGPPMAPTSMATARLMETWAHAHDVAAALGVPVPRTDRARHVAHLGVRTRNFAFGQNGLEAPAEEFRVELVGPSGDLWSWGPEDAAQRVAGDGWDFALVATRRLHPSDADLRAAGADAERWLGIVQAFAGPPGEAPKRKVSA